MSHVFFSFFFHQVLKRHISSRYYLPLAQTHSETRAAQRVFDGDNVQQGC